MCDAQGVKHVHVRGVIPALGSAYAVEASVRMGSQVTQV